MINNAATKHEEAAESEPPLVGWCHQQHRCQCSHTFNLNQQPSFFFTPCCCHLISCLGSELGDGGGCQQDSVQVKTAPIPP